MKENEFAHLVQRTNVVLCRCEGSATSKKGQCVVIWNNSEITMDAVKGVAAGSYQVRLELVVSSRVHHPLAYAYADGKVIGASLPKEFRAQIAPGMSEIRGGKEFQRFVEILKDFTTEDPVVADSYIPMLTEAYERGIAQTVDHVYDTAFMSLFPRTDWGAARGKMLEHGFLGIGNRRF